MKRLLNLGVSNPLTLGMAHPIADRLKSLGCAKPATKRGRAAALGIITLTALISAPFTVAADHPDKVMAFDLHIDGQAEKNVSYEVIEDRGEIRAYRILANGQLQEIDVITLEDGSLRIRHGKGEIVDVPNVGFGAQENLKFILSLENLEGLPPRRYLSSSEVLEGLDDLKALEALDGLDGLDALDGLNQVMISSDDFDGGFIDGDISVFVDDTISKTLGEGASLNPEALSKLKLTVQRSLNVQNLKRDNGSPQITVYADDGSILTETIVGLDLDTFQLDDPIGTARAQLEKSRRALEALSDDANLSYDVSNALRDIERAQKSLDQAEDQRLANE